MTSLDPACAAADLLAYVIEVMAAAARLARDDDRRADLARLDIDPSDSNHREMVIDWLSEWAPTLGVARWDLHVGRWDPTVPDEDAVGRVSRLQIRWGLSTGAVVFDASFDLSGRAESIRLRTPTETARSLDPAVLGAVTSFVAEVLPFYDF